MTSGLSDLLWCSDYRKYFRQGIDFFYPSLPDRVSQSLTESFQKTLGQNSKKPNHFLEGIEDFIGKGLACEG
ncbi:MAG: hypothetical protein KDK54_17785 [Leptospiraceae bacterium]|nr:hypothetical protein [Leptospiraceae bacterium]